MSASAGPRAIAIAVVQQDEWFLVGRRPPGVPLAGYWEFPGGKVRPAETAAEAAVRECREETGLAVRIVRRLPDQRHEYAHGALHLQFFLCEPLGRRNWPRSPFFWVPRSGLRQLEFPAGNQGVLEWLLREP